MAELERVYTIPLGKAYDYIRTKRARRAVKMVRAFLARHMKADESDVSISEGINSAIWKRGIQKPPRKLKVKVTKDKGKVTAVLIGELEEKEKLRQEKLKREEKKKGKPAEKKPEEKKEGEKEKKPKEKKEEKTPVAQVEKKEKPAQPKKEEKQAKKEESD